jgi:Methyltransferase domain
MDSKEAAAYVPDGSLDFVFIDADHSYEGCKADIQAWLPKLKPSGFISGHDYDNTDFPCFGVKQAVDEIFGPPETGANFTWRVRLAETWRLAL